MKNFYRALTFFLPLGLAAINPQAPKSVVLHPNTIMSIEVSSRADTVLIFPEEVTYIFGNGLTDGKLPGVVQYQLVKNGKILVLRPLQDDYVLLPKLVTESGSYVLELISSSEPCTLVEFQKPDGSKSEHDQRLTRLELQERLRVPSRERQMELISLSRSDSILMDQIPHEYDGYETKLISASTSGRGFDIGLNRVSRFRNDNCLIVHGSVINNQASGVTFPMNAVRLRIGGANDLRASQVFLDKAHLKPGEHTDFALLLGPSSGLNPGHISFRNKISLTLNSTRP